jgi:two-component system sensor histidine kinase/response regulator
MPSDRDVMVERLPAARVLAVDDVASNLVALESVLDPVGLQLATAKSGPEALALLEGEEFSVVLLDIQMPGMDGFTTLERMREGRGRHIPVIFLTAYSPTRDAIQRAYRLGAFDFITKPIEPDALRGKVQAFAAFHQRGRQLLRQAEALRSKDRYLAILAHDLRTPLAVVHMAAHALKSAQLEHVPGFAERILRSTQQMERLARDLLEAARAAAPALPAKKEKIDLGELCRALLDDFRTAYPRIEFVEKIEGGAVGVWDRDRLHQAISNLLSNAVKYGDGRVILELGSAAAGRASVTVSNGGAPIAPARLPEIFEPFVQGEAGSAGVGLGLHIVKEIAVAHAGDVVASSGTSGTTFTINLPLTPA